MGGLSSGLGVKKGPSKAFAGDGDLLPGMVGKPIRFCSTVSRICVETPDTSHESKPSSCDGGFRVPSNDD